MQFAFANPLRLPTPVVESLLFGETVFAWASYLAAGHVSDTLVTRGSHVVVGHMRQWFHQLRELLLLCEQEVRASKVHS